MIVCIIIATILAIIGIWSFIYAIVSGDDWVEGLEILGLMCILGFLIVFLPFFVLDKHSGTTIGIITAVDRNFFGTHKIYIKTAENNEDEYCIENKDILNQANEMVGKKVQVYYGKRIGFYRWNKCHEAPIDKIELREE